jgi:hypothetical protein
MSVQNDVKAVTLLLGASPDVVIPFRARVRSINYVASGTAGTILLEDGAGTELLSLVTPAGVGAHDVFLPDQGILFKDEVNCTLTDVTAITIFYS